MSIYEEIKKTGFEIDNHESDLYCLANDITANILKNYEFKSQVTIFTSKTDKRLWYDIPFAYSPYWDEKLSEADNN